MKFWVATFLLVGSLQFNAIGSKQKKQFSFGADLTGYMSDGLLEVEPLPRDFARGDCTCRCCTPEPEPIVVPCQNDIVIGVDSSACFRDYHSKMNRFMKKLVRRIGRTERIPYGERTTRLALMQFSSDIFYPLQLDDFENYRYPPTSRAITTEITREISNLKFLGEGSFLNRALNSSVLQFQNHPRSYVGSPNRVLILLTNGNSHPDVTIDDIENSIRGLKQGRVSVIPVAVTRECYGNSETWSEGLCPDTVVLKKLAKLGSPQETFLEMSSQDTITEIINYLQCGPASINNPCNNCTCSCELPVGPQGPPGPRGPRGDFVRGEPGEKGNIGPKGDIGLPGYIGPKGEKGFPGNKGNDGPPGQPGFSGRKGAKGEYGDKGRIGPKGRKGEEGPKGDKGFDGTYGPKGNRGDKGDIGPKGNVGDKGNIGPKGYRGPPGPRGPKGFGEKGMPGPPGDFGEKGGPGMKGGPGDKGMTGPPGLCGKPGPAGLPGEKGESGNDGSDGEPGPPGSQGPRGERGRRGGKGESGRPGNPGIPGSLGLTGERGPRGPQGPYGSKGEKGEPSNVAGSPGLPGIPGAKGLDGSDGQPGNDGREGTPGKQGPRGYPGLRGPPGELDLNRLRPMLIELIREMIPGDCVKKQTCQEYPVDIAFLIDGSDSIDREDFDRTKNWVLQTVDAFKSSNNNIPLYVAVVQYSEDSQIELDTLVNAGSQEISDTVRNIVQMRSGTKTYSALKFVDDYVYPLMRSDSYKILITMTDGDASEPRNVAAIEQAHEQFDRMVAVGVGPKTDREELLDFSSNERVFSVENFEALEGIIAELVRDTCSGLDQALESTTTPGGTIVPTPTAPGCYNAISDFAFVIDGSSSVGQSGFSLLRSFLYTVVSEFQNVGENGIKVAMVQYSDEPRLELSFKESTTKNVVLNSIANMQYLSGNTRTGFALQFLKNVVFDQNGRSNAKKVAVVITDGRSQDDVITPANALKNDDVLMFAIGVGEAEEDELIEIASSPAVDYVYNVADYVAISSIKDILVQNVCKQSEGEYSGPGEESRNDNEVIFPGVEQPLGPSAGPDDLDGSGNTEYAL